MDLKPTDDGRFFLRENGSEREVSKEDLEKAAAKKSNRLKQEDDGHYVALERMKG